MSVALFAVIATGGIAAFAIFTLVCNAAPVHRLPEPGRPPWLRGGHKPRGSNADGEPVGHRQAKAPPDRVHAVGIAGDSDGVFTNDIEGRGPNGLVRA